MTDCNGDGFCLRQGDGPNGYELNNCPYKCKLIECPNFKICGSLLPKCISFCHKGTCMTCAYMFGRPPLYNGKLTFYDSLECPVCYENKPGVKQINCDHTLCIDCFQRCMYGQKMPQPPFPYSKEIEDEYENNHDDTRWVNDPLIKKYNRDFQLYEAMSEANFVREGNLRICVLCRK